MKFMSVVGARPNFMKLAPVARELATRDGVEHVIVHTGQHYDAVMSDTFFTELGLPQPHHHLGVGSHSHAVQTAGVMTRIEPILEQEAPDALIVYGDVNSTMAAALVASKLGVRVAHVEAGLRSNDRAMPEEINRIVTDRLSDVLLAPSPDAVDNLRNEGVPPDRIHFVGNVMIDTLVQALPQAEARNAPARLGVATGRYVVTTLHRPANVDDPAHLRAIIAALVELSRDVPVLFPVHPRTRHWLAAMEIDAGDPARFRLLDPLGYLDMLSLVSHAALVITDSGGLQEETTFLGVPCLTVRPSTERPITCTQGTNRLVSGDRDALLHAARDTLRGQYPSRPAIDQWDGRAAERIACVLCHCSDGR